MEGEKEEKQRGKEEMKERRKKNLRTINTLSNEGPIIVAVQDTTPMMLASHVNATLFCGCCCSH